MSDPVDAFWTTTVFEHDGKPFKSVAQGSADLDAIEKTETSESDGEETADKPGEGEIATLIALLKQTLEGKISDVRSSDRLTDKSRLSGCGGRGYESTNGAYFGAKPRRRG